MSHEIANVAEIKKFLTDLQSGLTAIFQINWTQPADEDIESALSIIPDRVDELVANIPN